MPKTTRITKIFTFDAAHRLNYHDGKCCQVHGHTYKLEVTVGGPVRPVDGRPDSGMILDFGILKRIVNEEILDRVDHELLNDVDLFEYTTAEIMAEEMFAILVQRLAMYDDLVYVHCIRLWETPTSYAEVVNE